LVSSWERWELRLSPSAWGGDVCGGISLEKGKYTVAFEEEHSSAVAGFFIRARPLHLLSFFPTLSSSFVSWV